MKAGKLSIRGVQLNKNWSDWASWYLFSTTFHKDLIDVNFILIRASIYVIFFWTRVLRFSSPKCTSPIPSPSPKYYLNYLLFWYPEVKPMTTKYLNFTYKCLHLFLNQILMTFAMISWNHQSRSTIETNFPYIKC